MGHILVVDDEPAMLQLIRRVLEKDRHLISLISDAQTALNMNCSKYDPGTGWICVLQSDTFLCRLSHYIFDGQNTRG